MKEIEIAGWKKTSCDDGPGIRSVLFLQGCNMNCPGCHNKTAQKRGEGILMCVNEVAEFVIQKCHNKRLTISGGEPLEQWDVLRDLLDILNSKGFDICVYTGWNIERIPEDVFALADYIKTGSFITSMKSDNIHYVGSSNQKMYYKELSGNWKELNLQISA